MKLGLLEFGTGCVSPMDIVENVLNYAVEAETLGYTRFWLAEHYGESPAYCNPEVLIPIIAGLTNQMKVGVAGLLMTYHNPYRVASAFKVLNNLFPNRIDLGIAKGGVPGALEPLLVPDLDLTDKSVWANTFRRNSSALFAYLRDPVYTNQIVPFSGFVPPIWSLSASLNNVQRLASLNTSLCKSLFHGPITSHAEDAEKLARYRDEFFQRHQIKPEITLAVTGLCAETGKKAQTIRASLRRPPSVCNELIGSPIYLLDKIARLGECYGINEFIFMNMAEETGHKLKGIELLARHLPAYSTAMTHYPAFETAP